MENPTLNEVKVCMYGYYGHFYVTFRQLDYVRYDTLGNDELDAGWMDRHIQVEEFFAKLMKFNGYNSRSHFWNALYATRPRTITVLSTEVIRWHDYEICEKNLEQWFNKAKIVYDIVEEKRRRRNRKLRSNTDSALYDHYFKIIKVLKDRA